MKRSLLALVCVVVAVSMAGCVPAPPASSDSAKKASESAALDWYVNFNWYTTPFGGNAVSKEIAGRTGVNVNIVSPKGNESVTLDALIAGDGLPDLITLGWWTPQLDSIIDQGLAWPLNELADKYCPAFWNAANDSRVKWYTHDDGNLYCYPNSSCLPQDLEKSVSLASNQVFLVRKDMYEALGRPDMTTPEGFSDAVRRAAGMFQTVDGQPLIPIGAHEFTDRGCDSFDIFLHNFLAIPYEKDGRFYDRYADEEYKRWLNVFRELGAEGLLAGDIFIDKRVQMEEKIAQGRYFCMIYQHSDMTEQQLTRFQNDPNSVYIAVDGPRNAQNAPHELPGRGLNGWTVTLISKNCKNPQKAVELMTFLMSEEGQKLTALGVEGEHYTMKNGRAELKPDVKTLMDADYGAYVSEIGANNSYWMLQDNAMQAEWMPEAEPVIRQMQEWSYQYTRYTGQYEVVFAEGSQADTALDAIEQIHGDMLPLLLLAPTREEFDRLWDEYQNRRAQAGIGVVITESDAQMRINKRRLDME